MMRTDLSEFISAGFLITREVERPSYVSAELLPARIVSASECVASFVPDTLCIDWTAKIQEDRNEFVRFFAMKPQALEEITEWTTQRFGASIRWPNVIVDLGTVKELIDRFLNDFADIRVLELGLHKSMVDAFCRVAEPPPQEPGFAPNGRQGVHEMILEAKAPAEGGRVLGFEPLDFYYTLSCSWLCNGLEIVIDQALGIKPNPYGLIETFDEARSCVEYISRDDGRAERGLWLPWLVIDHTENVFGFEKTRRKTRESAFIKAEKKKS